LVESPQLPQDARSTEYKKTSLSGTEEYGVSSRSCVDTDEVKPAIAPGHVAGCAPGSNQKNLYSYVKRVAEFRSSNMQPFDDAD
jgi:hypothetical protein